jgi:hypothetical protein
MDITLFGVFLIWPASALWMQALNRTLLVITLAPLILLGGAGVLVVVWLVSAPARSHLYRWSTTSCQQKLDLELAKLDDTIQIGLGDLAQRPVVIDVSSEIPF